MFHLKVPSILRNISKIHSPDGGNHSLFRNALFSTETVNSVTKPVPDKLYKMLEIEVRGNDPAVLRSYGIYAVTAAQHLGITVGRNIAPRKAVHERLTVLKSVHIYKLHRVQYETRTYYRFLQFFKLTGSTADTFLEYIQRNLPEGVAMKATKVEICKLPESVEGAASKNISE